MSWLDRFRRTCLDGADSDATVARELAALQLLLLRNAERMTVHAGQAPSPPARSGLSALAAEDADSAVRLHRLLTELGGPIPLVHAKKPEQSPAASHWARLCQDLDGHLAALARLNAARIRVDSPDLQTRIEHLATREQNHVKRLRDLIARADPHALN